MPPTWVGSTSRAMPGSWPRAATAGPWPWPRSGLVVALVRRQRPMILFGVLGAASALAVVLEPQGKLYNTRFVPLWWICVYLLAGFAVAEAGVLVATVGRRWRARLWASTLSAMPDPGAPVPGTAGMRLPRVPPWAPGAVAVPLVALVAVLAVVLPPLLVAPNANVTLGPLHIRSNNVKYWAQWNYSGYERKPAWPEMQGLVSTMERVARREGCGRAMWEYNADLVRFGTPMAPMLLPHWTDGCIDSMEGLLFESSATTPYHFIDQAELSAQPSEAVVPATTGIRYGPLDVALGVEHLRLLGVRYFLASSPSVQAQADADPGLTLVATSGPWSSVVRGPDLHNDLEGLRGRRHVHGEPARGDARGRLRVGRGAELVAARGPAVVRRPGDAGARSSWPAGPPSWPRVTRRPGPFLPDADADGAAGRARLGGAGRQRHGPLPRRPHRACRSWYGCRTSRAGMPTGADGPWRATPNLMVVVPTAHDVALHYGSTPAGSLGAGLDPAGRACASAALVLRRRRGLHDSLTGRFTASTRARPTIVSWAGRTARPGVATEGGHVQLVTRRRSAVAMVLAAASGPSPPAARAARPM